MSMRMVGPTNVPDDIGPQDEMGNYDIRRIPMFEKKDRKLQILKRIHAIRIVKKSDQSSHPVEYPDFEKIRIVKRK